MLALTRPRMSYQASFVFFKQLVAKEKIEIVINERDKIRFCVKAVDPNSGYLKLVSKYSEDEKKKRHEEFISRTRANIQRWEDTIAKSRENIAKNQVKARTARSKEWEDRFKLWIAEDEKKIRDLLSKIESARSRLRQR